MNKVALIGRLTKDPELRFTAGAGTAVTTFTLAVDRGFKNKDGQKEADFINIVAWQKLAETIANYLRKGSLVAIGGRIQTRNYEGNDGKKVYVTEVIAEDMQFLDSKDKTVSGNGNNTPQSNDGFTPVDMPEDSDLPF